MSFATLPRPATTGKKSLLHSISNHKLRNETFDQFKNKASITESVILKERICRKKLSAPKKVTTIQNLRYKGWQALSSLTSLNKPIPSPYYFRLTTVNTCRVNNKGNSLMDNTLKAKCAEVKHNNVLKRTFEDQYAAKIAEPKEEENKMSYIPSREHVKLNKKLIKLNIKLPDIKEAEPVFANKQTVTITPNLISNKRRKTILLKIKNIKELSQDNTTDEL